jgi:uncharacterized protein (DUF2164 family)
MNQGLSLSKEQKREILISLQRYFGENFEGELSDVQANSLLEYFLKEIAPFAYNKGVEDARNYFQGRVEDLPGACFEEPLTYWENAKSTGKAVRRKPSL